jgi:hypothetical protein
VAMAMQGQQERLEARDRRGRHDGPCLNRSTLHCSPRE